MTLSSSNLRLLITWGGMALLILLVGIFQGPTNAIMLINIGLISGLMALGLNMQWGYAGLFNAGVMGSVVVGAIMVILVTHNPIPGPNMPPELLAGSGATDEARATAQAAYDGLLADKRAFDGGLRGLLISIAVFAAFCLALAAVWRRMTGSKWRAWIVISAFILGYIAFRIFYDPAVRDIEAYQTASFGNIGGIGLGAWFEWLRLPFPGFWSVLVAWFIGGLAAGGVAWIIGKITLGLRSDYFAIATLGIAEIVVSFAKNEQWLTRGVKNVNAGSIGTPIARPASSYANQDPQNGEIIVRGMQDQPWVQKITAWFQGYDLAAFQETLAINQLWDFRYLEGDFRDAMVTSAKLANLLSYTLLISVVLGLIFFLAYRALNSPWGRMMRAIRDNETAANAMGKNVVGRHLQVFVLGSIVIGIAGAMLVVVSGAGFTPTSYLAMRFTFLIWVMVIVGGSGNNSGVILGGMLIWFLWVQSDPIAGGSFFGSGYPDGGLAPQIEVSNWLERIWQWLAYRLDHLVFFIYDWIVRPILWIMGFIAGIFVFFYQLLPDAWEGGINGAMGSAWRAFVGWYVASVSFFKFFFLGLILLLVLRFAPKGLIPEKGSERRR